VKEKSKLVGEWPSWPHSYEAGSHTKLAQRGQIGLLFCKTSFRGLPRLPRSLRLNCLEDWVKGIPKLVGEWPRWPHSYEAGSHSNLAQRGKIGLLFWNTSFRGLPRLPLSLRLNLLEDCVKEIPKLIGEWPSWPHSYEAGSHIKVAQRGKIGLLFCKTYFRGLPRLPKGLRLKKVEDSVKEISKLVGKWPSWPQSYEAGSHTKLAQRGKKGLLFCKTSSKNSKKSKIEFTGGPSERNTQIGWRMTKLTP
jgi:hypothetical protein